MAIGEAGSITTSSPTANQPITVNLTDPLTDPVIVMSSTSNGGHMFTLRVVDEVFDADGNTTSFSFIIEEWEYLDGPHPASETINWMAVESGVHTLPDGRVIEAGTTNVDAAGSSVSFAGSYGTDTPVVLTSVMSENDTTTVDSDPLNITSAGFDIALQEEEAQAQDHATESIGWIAIQPGGDGSSGTANNVGGVDHNTDVIGLGATFSNPVVLVDTQTINGPNTATVKIDGQTASTVGVYIEEEQSLDSEIAHINENVGIVAFEDGLIPCFTRGARIETESGPKPVEKLVPGDLLVTRDNGLQPVRWICRRHLDGDFLATLPRRDMLVSPQHRMLLRGWNAQLFCGEDEVLVPACGLLNDASITRMAGPEPVTYFHVLLDRHEVIRADGVWTESLHAGQLSKRLLPNADREELFSLFPGLRSFDRDFGATARQVVTVREASLLNPVFPDARTH